MNWRVPKQFSSLNHIPGPGPDRGHHLPGTGDLAERWVSVGIHVNVYTRKLTGTIILVLREGLKKHFDGLRPSKPGPPLPPLKWTLLFSRVVFHTKNMHFCKES